MGMSHAISYFIGNQTNAKNGEVFIFGSFEELAKEFCKCAKGTKHSAYFVRGKLDPVERKDKNLDTSTLIIIDGDEGVRGRNAPPPKVVHEALKEMGYNHFLYTTHSHCEEKNKFRVVIEAGPYTKKDVRVNNKTILDELAALGVGIKFVKEMNTWSQPWFVPTRDDPDDGFFESYSYFDGKPWEIIEVTEDTPVAISDDDSGNTETLEQMYENVRTGAEYHTSLRTISYQHIKDGMTAPHVKAFLKALLNGSEDAGSERWQTRFNDVDRLVDGAVITEEPFKICEVSLFEEKGQDIINNIPMPPGRLGKLVQEAYESSRYPDYQVAMVASLGVIAGICGRKFNVDFADKTGKSDPTGLNLYLTLVGGTGVGKDGIGGFINQILVNGSGIKSAQSFLGSGEFTSVRALDHQVKDARSQVCIDGEAGISMKNKTGDRAGVRKAILSLYGRSHHTGWSDPKTYSNSEETIPRRRAIALTRISESTEVELFAAYRDSDAFENGLIPRQSIFRIINPNTTYNRNIRTKLSSDINRKFNALIDVCQTVQAVEDPDSHFIHCDDEDLIEEMYRYADVLKKQSVSSEASRIVQIMSSRMFVKALRYSGIAVVFNKDKSTTDCLVLGWEEWEWAKQMVQYELSSVEHCFAGYEDTADGAVLKVANCISKLLLGTHPNRDANRLSEDHRKQNVVPVSVLQRLLRRDADIKSLVADPTRSFAIQDGLGKCLDYMDKVGTIERFNKGKQQLIRVLPPFNDIYYKEMQENKQ